MRSLDQLRSLSGSTKNFQMSSQPTSDSISIGSFANLKLTAEKLVKEQTSVKTDLEMETLKLKKFTEHIHALEEKLQNAIIEDVKLKVKQKEDVKLWKGLESKFSSTKALCNQLTETLQQLAVQIRDTEQDKKIFENKLNASSNSFDSLQLQCSGISVKLESAEHNMKKHEQQLLELKSEKEKEKTFMDEYNRTWKHTEEKDSLIKHLEGAVSAEKMRLESLTSRLEEVQHELRVKEDICQHLKVTQENLEKEKHSLESINNDYADGLLQSGQELKGLEDSLHRLVEKSVELDNHSLVIVKWAQCQFGRLHDRFLHVTSENSEFRSEKEDLNKKVVELHKDQEVLMVQHAEECRITEQKIQGLESESQTLVLKEASLELQVAKLEENNEHLSETSSVSENKMKDLILRISTLEPEKQEIQDQLQVTIQGKSEEIEVLQKEIARHEELVDCLEKQASQLHDTLEEKEQLHLQFTDREKQFEDRRTEILASLAVVENTLTDRKKQYDLILESKLMERSKHLKEISQRNDQILSIQQEHDKKVSDLRADHSEELRHARLEAEDELRENQRHMKMEKWKKRDGFPTQATIIIFLLLISFITPVMSASDEIKWVTLENIEIFTTHDWNNSTPIVYFRCQAIYDINGPEL